MSLGGCPYCEDPIDTIDKDDYLIMLKGGKHYQVHVRCVHAARLINKEK